MSDLFLILGQTPAGPTCFLVPRVLDDGTRNTFMLQRLKDKLGNRSNASSEIELDGTWGVRLGDEGRGIRTILDMVAATRLDCVLGSSATMRQALVRAIHHTRHRAAFGRPLVDQPLMRNVLMDLALESEAATTLGLRLAAAVDEGDTAFSRLAVAVGKYWVCKRTAPMVAEALECLGGNGLVEENGLARLYREAPVNSIWEGSGNVVALDVLRALTREPAAVAAFAAELDLARGADTPTRRRHHQRRVSDGGGSRLPRLGGHQPGGRAVWRTFPGRTAGDHAAGLPADAPCAGIPGRGLRGEPSGGGSRKHVRHSAKRHRRGVCRPRDRAHVPALRAALWFGRGDRSE